MNDDGTCADGSEHGVPFPVQLAENFVFALLATAVGVFVGIEYSVVCLVAFLLHRFEPTDHEEDDARDE